MYHHNNVTYQIHPCSSEFLALLQYNTVLLSYIVVYLEDHCPNISSIVSMFFIIHHENETTKVF